MGNSKLSREAKAYISKHVMADLLLDQLYYVCLLETPNKKS